MSAASKSRQQLVKHVSSVIMLASSCDVFLSVVVASFFRCIFTSSLLAGGLNDNLLHRNLSQQKIFRRKNLFSCLVAYLKDEFFIEISTVLHDCFS